MHVEERGEFDCDLELQARCDAALARTRSGRSLMEERPNVRFDFGRNVGEWAIGPEPEELARRDLVIGVVFQPLLERSARRISRRGDDEMFSGVEVCG